MGKIVSFLFLLVGAFLSWFYARVEPSPLPCVEPIAYSIGSFDRRFGVKQVDFISALVEAENIWEKPLSKDLFSYSPQESKLDVNLIYDYRQQATKELTLIEGAVKEDKSGYQRLEALYASLKAEHEVLKSAYELQVVSFNAQSALYEEHVDNWNNGPRRSQSEFASLETERRALEQVAVELKALEANLNAKVRQVNEMVAKLNALAKELNLNVEEYNSIGASRGETFAGGTYTSDVDGERIDIFEFQNHAKLVRVLAHELGHALGLEHVEDPQAIMYYLDEGAAGKPTEADLDALKVLCSVQ